HPEMDHRKRAEAAVAKARAEAEAKKRAEAEAKRRAEAEARQRAELEAKAREDVEAKARAELEAKALAEAEEHKMAEEARAPEDEFQRRAREEAELREREEAQASGRSIEEIRALEGEKRRAREEAAAKARAQAEAKSRIEADAKARVEAEAQARLDSEAKARLDAQAKERAEAEMKARAEAEAKARVEAEAKARLDAEAKARAEAELKARVEAEVKARVEAKAKALVEAEAKARAEADRRAREEAERRTREEAERRAREEADRRAHEEAERRAREEAERRAREEAERRARDEAERQQAREEAERRAREDAEAKARTETERRAREEAVSNARLEEERRMREEADAKARAEAARRTREEAEAAARTGEEPGARDEAEASKRDERDRQAAAGARVPHEADSRAFVAGLSAATDGADKARLDATAAETAQTTQPLVAPSANDLVRKLKAKVQAEWRARGKSKGPTIAPSGDNVGSADLAAAGPPSDTDPPDISAALRELNAEPVSHAEPVASDRAAAEHVPNALESAMLQSARNEPAQSYGQSEPRGDSGKAAAERPAEPAARDFRAMDNAAIPLSQRVNADRAAHDVLARAATERNYVNAALGHTVADEDGRRNSRALRRQRQTRVFAALGILLVAAPVLATAWLQFVPLDSYIPEAQQALSEQLNQPATISTLRYVLLPTPRLVLEGVKVGQGIRIERVEAPALPQALSSVPRIFDTITAHGLTIDAQTLGTLPDWKIATSSGGVRVRRLALDGVKIEGADVGLPTLNGEVTFTTDGAPRQASFTSEKLKLDVVPDASGLRIVLTAQDSRIPFGPQVKFSHFTIAGGAARKRFTSTDMSASIGSGSLIGTLQASWDGQITVAGDFKVQRVRLQEFTALVAPELAASGMLTASGRYTFQSQTADTLMAKPVVEATFSLSRGEITNIDLLRATQSSGSHSFSGGRTMFEEVKGSLQIAGGQYSYRLQLTSGPLNASGNLAVAPSGQLSGRVNAVLAAHGAEVARTALNVGGTVKEPQLAQ
ncbi:MAG TPA: hypothetical protein VGC70_02385, partial [Burkholderiales bacterium]